MPVGGARPGAGRKPGKVGAAKRVLAEMAKEFAPDALETLRAICRGGESESARVAAANAILDRAYGRPPQALQVSGDAANPVVVAHIERTIIDPAQDVADRNASGIPTAH